MARQDDVRLGREQGKMLPAVRDRGEVDGRGHGAYEAAVQLYPQVSFNIFPLLPRLSSPPLPPAALLSYWCRRAGVRPPTRRVLRSLRPPYRLGGRTRAKRPYPPSGGLQRPPAWKPWTETRFGVLLLRFPRPPSRSHAAPWFVGVIRLSRRCNASSPQFSRPLLIASPFLLFSSPPPNCHFVHCALLFINLFCSLFFSFRFLSPSLHC